MATAFSAFVIETFDPLHDVTDASLAEKMRAELWAHGVICLRCPAALTDEQARAIVAMIGPVKDPVGRARDGATLRYGEDRQIIDAGFVLTPELRAELGAVEFGGDADRPGLFEFFHTDDSYTECPSLATVLHARELPSGSGGNTRFLDMRAAYQSLDDATKERIAPLRAVHAYNNEGAFPPRAAARGALEELVDVSHPVVRVHPVVKTPALYFDLDRAAHIEGLPIAEGRALLRMLQDHAEASAPQYAHAWQPNDVLMWDNASVQHKASGDFPVGEPRRFWRYMVEGPKPTGLNS